jgi:ATP-dependent Clp protease ATP-binding subunit ClpX
LTKQYKKLFEMEEKELTFTDDALVAIAKRAIERKTGARGLRSILENLLLETMFDLPDMNDVGEIVVEEKTITEGKEPKQVKKKKSKAKPKADKAEDVAE